MNENVSNHETKENIYTKINDINNNISFFTKNDISPKKMTNIKKEMKKRTNAIRRYFNINNSIFKEMVTKQNSLIYQSLVKSMGKYFFGPGGKVTEKYKLLKDYYEEKDLQMNLNNKICAGTLDYFSLISTYDSYSQRINSTKQQILFSSSNLSVARSGFDMIDQNAMSKNKLFNKHKNFVNINIKNIKNFYNNNMNIKTEDKRKKERNNIIIKKLKINMDENNEISKDNNESININNTNNNSNTKNNIKKNKINTTNDFSYKSVSPKNTIIERYSKESIIKELKQKLKYMEPYNYHPLLSFQNEKENNSKILKRIRIKDNLSKKIKPIIFLNRHSIMDLSFLKKYEIKSKNERNAKRIILKKNLNNMLFDDSEISYLTRSKIPTLHSIKLSKKKENLKIKKHFIVENE